MSTKEPPNKLRKYNPQEPQDKNLSSTPSSSLEAPSSCTSSIPKDGGNSSATASLGELFKGQVVLIVQKGIGAIQCNILKKHVQTKVIQFSSSVHQLFR